jgi:hypothetical protein
MEINNCLLCLDDSTVLNNKIIIYNFGCNCKCTYHVECINAWFKFCDKEICPICLHISSNILYKPNILFTLINRSIILVYVLYFSYIFYIIMFKIFF